MDTDKQGAGLGLVQRACKLGLSSLQGCPLSREAGQGMMGQWAPFTRGPRDRASSEVLGPTLPERLGSQDSLALSW